MVVSFGAVTATAAVLDAVRLPGVMTPVPFAKTPVSFAVVPSVTMDGLAVKLLMEGWLLLPPPPPLLLPPPQPASVTIPSPKTAAAAATKLLCVMASLKFELNRS